MLEAVEGRRRASRRSGAAPASSTSCTVWLPAASKSVCSCMSNSENSIWRSVCRPALEILRGQHLVVERARQRLRRYRRARVMCCSTSHSQQKFSMNWRRQFDRIPFDAGDARHAELVDLRQHVVQAVAELVEQRDHFVVGEQRRLVLPSTGAGARNCRSGRRPASACRRCRCAAARAHRPSRRRRACRCARTGRGRTGRPVWPAALRSMR